jgi:hypothetical protein
MNTPTSDKKITTSMKKEINIQVPATPNFLRAGDGEGIMLPIASFTDKELREVAKEWSDKLIFSAGEKRRKRITDIIE